ncbi:hypothetical protein PBY51_014621 [Eleginops maclovinus]|uniref:Uncharacterized protein n=1 Tax=Eleginops maclovinus TaxID=56733 RepID=A0AAN7X537_ELEMC|nr:hypothetical protein PBY51_014621 [Eleginops maclovinus]
MDYNPAAPQGPPVQEGTCTGRLKSASDPLKDSEKAYEKVMWSDETNIKILGINSTCRVWRKRNADYDPKNTIPSVKQFLC